MTKILLVEDDKSLREIYGVRLLAEGYDIVSAGDGEEALAMAIKERPELIISDLNMPRLEGIGLLNAVRSNPDWKDVAFVIMSANINDERLTPDVIASLNGVIPKPFNLDDLNMILSRV